MLSLTLFPISSYSPGFFNSFLAGPDDGVVDVVSDGVGAGGVVRAGGTRDGGRGPDDGPDIIMI
jgi:hypothetical protein